MQFQPPTAQPQNDQPWQPQENTGYPQWQAPPYPPQPEMYYPPSQPLPPQQQPFQQQYAQVYQPQVIVQQPTPQPPKKRLKKRWIVLAVIILIVIIAIANGSHGSSTTLTATTPTAQATTSTNQSTPTPDQSTPTQPAPTTFKVGETASNSKWSMTLNSVKTSTGDDVFSPKAGMIYLVADVTVGNLSSNSQTVSSLASFVLQDSTGQAYNESFSDIGKPPDGTIQPGSKLRGQLVYEVPKSEHDFTLQFQGSGFDGSSGTWAFHI